MFEALNTKLSSHLPSGISRHTADDIDYSENLTMKAAFDTEIAGMKNTLSDKVDKISGKTLSSNDYTNAEKEKLSGISPGAEVNLVKSVNGNTGAVIVSKSTLGLEKVDNTADLDKPVSTAVLTELSKMMTLEDYADTNQEGQEVQKRVKYASRADTAAFSSKAALCENADVASNAYSLGGIKANNYATKTYVDDALGDIETAVDSIIEIQNTLIGGTE